MDSLQNTLHEDEHIKSLVKVHFETTFSGVTSLSFQKYLSDTFSFKRAQNEYTLLEKKTGTDLIGKKILEVGCGFGTFLDYAIKEHQVDIYGVEPDQQSFDIAERLFILRDISRDRLIHSCGEQLPFKDNSFDLVYSSNVLEHTQNPAQVLKEAVRVLRPGGHLFFVVPNYGSWWDGHYGIFWIPHISKFFARLYVKLLGRDPRYIDELQLVTLKDIQNICRDFEKYIDVVDLGWDIWEYRIRTMDFNSWASLPLLKNVLAFCHKTGMVSLIIYLGRVCGWLTPILLLAKKKGVNNG